MSRRYENESDPEDYENESDAEDCENESDQEDYENESYQEDCENESDQEDCENESDQEDNENESVEEDSKNESNPKGKKNKSHSKGKAKLDRGLKTQIFSTLELIKTPVAFAYSAHDPSLPNPVLHIPPYGTLGLPLSTDDVRKIISQAKQSPFGKGEATLVDTTVRKSWELNPNQFSLKNPAWEKALKTVLDNVTMGLGLAKGTVKVSAQLHKLLLYEPGAFFKPHKDSEKVPGMFATLVVCLPSSHEGGKLVMTHDNEKHEFETASSSSFGSSYAAWYSDITHEVLPVVSGYRLVLTYNLIRQGDFETPSFSSARGRVKHLSTLLQQYDSRLKEGDDKLPPILVHKLERKYTKASLKLKALKPPDLAQVQMLSQLSTELGFDIYLTTLELVINKDDECDDYEEKEQETLENVVALNGKLVVESLEYPDGALIDPKGQNEDEADESEHEGHTGNEGAPAKYWYRNTVVVLVPPSKQLNLVFEFKSDGSIIEPLFNKMMQDFSTDPAKKPKLEQLCKLALQQKPNYYRHYQSSIPAYFQQAAVTALDLGRIDLFDIGCKTTNNKIILENARVLGRSTADHGVATMTDLLMKGVQVASSVAKKVEFLKAVAEGFESAEQKPSSAERVSLKQWSDEAILTAVVAVTTLTKDDAKFLAQLCKTIDWSLFESKTKPVVLKAVTMTKITFINELMSTLQDLDEKQKSFIATIIRNIWKEFVFKPKSPQSEPQMSSYYSWQQPKSTPVNKDNLDVNDILHITEITATILSPECAETTIVPAMLKAIPAASKECSKGLFISLVQMILKNKLAGFKLRTNSTGPPPSHKHLVQAFLTKFLLENVGHEPQPPTDWSLPARSCKCDDCSLVNEFLQDPRRESFDLRCVQSRRKHLYQNFTNSRCDEDAKGSSYDVTIVRGRSPYIWRITKHRRAYETAKSDWMEKTNVAVKTLSALIKDKPMNSKLETYLEPYYSIIMSANVKQLPDLKSLVTMPQSSETKENAASVHNQATNKTGHKRVASDIDPPEDTLAKQTKL